MASSLLLFLLIVDARQGKSAWKESMSDANNKELTNSTLTTGMEGHLRNCRGRLTNTTINWLQGGDIANRNNNGMSYVEDMVWHDSAFTHQLVRTADIARTRDDDYPDVDNWELYNNNLDKD